MAVWAEDEEVWCVHPGGPRLSGIDKVRESWRRIFAGNMTMRFELQHRPSQKRRYTLKIGARPARTGLLFPATKAAVAD